ncbi:SHOCT domain-containing protein [Nocardia terpenica]|uniref:SHOCT domain-containing protein n=1 Tax=Nocardia terpenica TaxID=455432 RepID=A0A164P0C5_9NOCA|nr:SHOCT domain-containing protein [Nocardia terpenica]KZM74947.1 hypothetical protein AWN90_23330 [Nocardia terpenica]NQE93391.1 SHOCT domain-containing protein [Nocardia terpenica]
MTWTDRLTYGLATAAAVTGIGLVAFAPITQAQPDIPCDQWQQMHPGWPCIPVPKPIPAPPPTPSPLPTPVMPGQPPSGGGSGTNAGALTPPPLAPGNGTPIVPAPGTEPPALPGNQPPAPPAASAPTPPQAPTPAPPLPQAPGPAPAPATSDGADVASQLERARKLHDQGVLSDREFADLEQRILGHTPAPATPAPEPARTRPPAPSGPDNRIPALLLTGAGAFVLSRFRPRTRFADARFPPGAPSAVDMLPGIPPPVAPVPDGTPVLTSRFSITRLYPGVYAPPGWSSRDFNANPGIQGVYHPGEGPYSGWGNTIPLDPDTTPGAVGPWSDNVLKPDPITGKTGISIPTGGKGPYDNNNSLDLNITKKVQLRIVGLKPIVVSSFDLDGNPVLAVTYEPIYQVRSLYYGGGTMIVGQPSQWTDVSIDDVQTLERMGAFVPVVPAKP